jgi:hypothetical protein
MHFAQGGCGALCRSNRGTRLLGLLAYRKKPGPDWPEEEFTEQEVKLVSGNVTTMGLAERGVYLGNKVWVREIRRLTASGHQTGIVATDYRSDLAVSAASMFARWCQEDFFRYLDGILYAAGLENSSGSVPPVPADVINMSFSTPDPSGDTRADGDGYPDGVLSTRIDPATGDYGYGFLSGTSMAAPHVSGVAALCRAANPSLTVGELEHVLLSTAADLGPPGRDDAYGHGLVDAAGAVAEALARRDPGEDPLLDPALGSSVLSFGDSQTVLDLELPNLGGGTLQVEGVTARTADGAGWLRATPVPTTPVAIRVVVARQGLAPGEYSGEVQVATNGGSGVAAVRLQVSAGDDAFAPGPALVRLLAPAGGHSLREVEAHRDRGYAYEFPEVPPGRYLLVAGVDPDGDGVICEAGEYCAAYPALSNPQPVVVGAGEALTGLDLAGEIVLSDRTFP